MSPVLWPVMKIDSEPLMSIQKAADVEPRTRSDYPVFTSQNLTVLSLLHDINDFYPAKN